MNLMIKALLAVFWLFFAPGAAGALFLRKNKECTISMYFLTGYLFFFSLAEILILPMIYLDLPLHILVWIFGTAVFLAAVCGLFVLGRNLAVRRTVIKEKQTGSPIYLLLAVLFIAVQIVVMVFYAHMDADDSFYVGTASTDVYTDTIFSVNPYTGEAYSSLPSRYVLSPFPVLLAVVSRLCGGLHPAIVAHVVYPVVFMGLAYMVLYQLGRKWFPKERDSRGIFLLLCALLIWFSGYSIYNSGNFQLVRIWQGKAVLASVLLPLLFYLCISIIMEKRPSYSWLLLGMANTGCCLLSSMGIILAPLVTGIFLLLGLFRFRSLKRTIKGCLCCLPSLILGIIYLLIR
jgi:hypothetical protein